MACSVRALQERCERVLLTQLWCPVPVQADHVRAAVYCVDVGVSLCEAEASVAAPMTSKQQSITSMISVVAEGRCALLATYQIFQFIVGYAMAQAFATNLMYTHALQMGNYQYLIGVSVWADIAANVAWADSAATWDCPLLH